MTLKQTVADIKKLKIQGATNVAKAAAEALIMEGERNQRKPLSLWQKAVVQAAWHLEQTRPTEPMMVNTLHYLIRVTSRLWSKPDLGQQALVKSWQSLSKQYQNIENRIVHFGSQLIGNNTLIMTHCHSSTVEKIMLKAFEHKKFSVVNTETRPLFQGHITALHLTKAGVPVTMIVDSAAASFLADSNDPFNNQIHIDQVIIGADALLHDGSVINKIGSYGIALAAYINRIPVYVAASLLKLDSDNQVAIEQRSAKEIWRQPGLALELINPAFDKVPAKLISGIICERGVIKPKDLLTAAAKEYPWLLES